MAFPQFVTPLDPENFPVRRCPTDRRRAPQRILIVMVGALGGVLMITPLLTALRSSYPEAYLAWLVDRGNLPAIEANPYLDEIVSWDSEYWGTLRSTRPRNWTKNYVGLGWLAASLRLKALFYRRYDTIISFHTDPGQILMRMVRPSMVIEPSRTLLDKKTRKPRFLSPSAYHNVQADDDIHKTEFSLITLQALGLPAPTDKRMMMGFTTKDAESIYALRDAHGIEEGFVVFAPMTTWRSKIWPAEYWSNLGDALAKQGKQVVLIGANSEAPAIRRIALAMRSRPICLAGILTFRQSAALVARAGLCVCNDSGPMHMSAAVGTPFIAIFGPTPITRFAPLSGEGKAIAHPVPCGPCMMKECPNPPETYMQCMRLVTVSQVLDEALSIIGSPQHSRQPLEKR